MLLPLHSNYSYNNNIYFSWSLNKNDMQGFRSHIVGIKFVPLTIAHSPIDRSCILIHTWKRIANWNAPLGTQSKYKCKKSNTQYKALHISTGEKLQSARKEGKCLQLPARALYLSTYPTWPQLLTQRKHAEQHGYPKDDFSMYKTSTSFHHCRADEATLLRQGRVLHSTQNLILRVLLQHSKQPVRHMILDVRLLDAARFEPCRLLHTRPVRTLKPDTLASRFGRLRGNPRHSTGQRFSRAYLGDEPRESELRKQQQVLEQEDGGQAWLDLPPAGVVV